MVSEEGLDEEGLVAGEENQVEDLVMDLVVEEVEDSKNLPLPLVVVEEMMMIGTKHVSLIHSHYYCTCLYYKQTTTTITYVHTHY